MRLLLITLLLLSLSACKEETQTSEPLPPSTASLSQVTLDVPGMTCSMCPITVRKALEKVPGVEKAQSSFQSRSATVSFDPNKTSIETLLQATANAGYPASVKQE